VLEFVSSAEGEVQRRWARRMDWICLHCSELLVVTAATDAAVVAARSGEQAGALSCYPTSVATLEEIYISPDTTIAEGAGQPGA
jgi:hypothetical protein